MRLIIAGTRTFTNYAPMNPYYYLSIALVCFAIAVGRMSTEPERRYMRVEDCNPAFTPKYMRAIGEDGQVYEWMGEEWTLKP